MERRESRNNSPKIENNIFVNYPKGFKSQDKFNRKIRNYTSKISKPSFSAICDPEELLASYCLSNGSTFHQTEDAANDCTHAILFLDQRSDPSLITALTKRNIPQKRIPIKLTTVANKDRGEIFDVYIGRGTVWGNPYPIGREGDREEVLRKYKYDFDRKLLRFFENHDANIESIRGKILGCHCKPSACHGDIIADYVNSLDDGL
ncbi:DUF4326 domain-containing protein [Stenotrophomonas muris]|jgi:hypothetical protein|uniref:DUF4326 domain-containing protein n=1 Tax=Stenotrophomonas muris TaxID=2963283 RepID=UPI0021CA2B69|nr:DUF4326 domain-containing protein [Stenotrophomonas muris]MCU1120333.1 DUF4326 domain-containing protein [Stenotrophomonas maltophilia]MCU1130505.1 DUF4326 domain-containing protein [Stenotrophomonas maltophilia]